MTIDHALKEPMAPSAGETGSRAGVIHAATIIAAGNVASRVLGLAREFTIAYLFGATRDVSAFRVAATLVQQLYDFLVGGMASGALVPVFSDYAARENRDELWRVASIVLNVLAIGLGLAVLLLELFAPQLGWLYGAGYDSAMQQMTVGMIRLAVPAVFFLGLAGIVSGLLYTLKRFTYPAFTTAAFNAGIVVVAIALSPILGIYSLVLGIVAGSALQVLLQLPGLRDMRYRPVIDWRHPALRRIVKLYLPVMGGLTVAQVGVAIDRYLVSFTGEQSLAWMANATVLVQFPLGLVATAVSFAILPELSGQSSAAMQPGSAGTAASSVASHQFQSTLAFGIKLVLLLIVPAAVGLFVLAQPIVSILFEHGVFTPKDTLATSTALRFYLIGLPFAAIDQPLVFAFYSRKNTLTPNLVAFAGVAIYVLVALALIQTYGMVGLVIANSAQLTGHALIMLGLTQTRLADLLGQGLPGFLVKILAASAAMGLLVSAMEQVIGPVWLKVIGPGAVGAVAFVGLLWFLRVQEAQAIWQMVLRRLAGEKRPR